MQGNCGAVNRKSSNLISQAMLVTRALAFVWLLCLFAQSCLCRCPCEAVGAYEGTALGIDPSREVGIVRQIEEHLVHLQGIDTVNKGLSWCPTRNLGA